MIAMWLGKAPHTCCVASGSTIVVGSRDGSSRIFSLYKGQSPYQPHTKPTPPPQARLDALITPKGIDPAGGLLAIPPFHEARQAFNVLSDSVGSPRHLELVDDYVFMAYSWGRYKWTAGLRRLNLKTGALDYLTNADGLPGEGFVYALHFDGKHLWVGTDGGLCLLDPLSLKVFDKARHHWTLTTMGRSTPGPVYAIASGATKGEIWLGRAHGLTRIAPGEGELIFRPPNAFREDQRAVHRLVVVGSKIYGGSDWVWGLCVLDAETRQFHITPRIGYVLDINKCGQHVIAAGHSVVHMGAQSAQILGTSQIPTLVLSVASTQNFITFGTSKGMVWYHNHDTLNNGTTLLQTPLVSCIRRFGEHFFVATTDKLLHLKAFPGIE